MSLITSTNISKGINYDIDSSNNNNTNLKIAIVYAKWNEAIVSSMKSAAIKIMTENGIATENITEFQVPGAYELSFACKSIIKNNPTINVVIALGCLIKGETSHFEYISSTTSQSLQKVGLETGVPIIFGVLTVLNIEQAKARAGLTENSHNHGNDYGYAAIEMANFKFIGSKL